MVMTERLADFKTIDTQLAGSTFCPESLMAELLHGMAFTKLDTDQVNFGCWCSELRLISALSTLGKQEIGDLVKSGEILEISCDYCTKQYRISPAKLQGLLAQS